MTELTIALALALAAGSAGADPISHCAVTIARAPEAIRGDVEAALARERTCAIPLEVRIIETDGGYYVFARDPRGRVREHVAPDARSIGVLVASWAADDDVAPTAQPAADVPFRAPAEAPPAVALSNAPAVAGAPPPARWLAFTVATGVVGYGARLDVDLWHRGGLAFGAAGAVEDTKIEYIGGDDVLAIQTHDYRGLATGSYSATWHGWRARAELAAGFAVVDAALTSLDLTGAMPTTTGSTAVFPTIDGQLLVGYNLSDQWGLDIGVISELYARTYHFVGSDLQLPPWELAPVTTVSTPTFDWKLAVSLRRSL